MSERDWHDIINDVVNESARREAEEIKKMREEIPFLITKARDMSSAELLDYYTDICRKGFAQPKKTVIWNILVDEVRLELRKRFAM
jgi:hypothetical protein